MGGNFGAPLPTPQSTPITVTAPIQWSNGQNFDGWLLFAICLPTSGGNAWPQLSYAFNYPSIRLPQFTLVPVANGMPNTQTFLFFNTQITPPNTKYASWVLDTNRQVIAGPSTLFTVTSAPYVYTPPTLTVPTAPVTAPSIVTPIPANTPE